MKRVCKSQFLIICISAAMLFLVTGGYADATDWRISPQATYFGSHERNIVSGSICDKQGSLSRANQGLSCVPCPSYTGNAGDSELEVTRVIHGSFSKPGAKEILINTLGCEPRFHGFGGAVLLETIKSRRKRVAYMPGFNLDDCIVSKGKDKKNYLACNEVMQGQGQLVGQISIFKVNAQHLERWRLLRWYDNLQSDSDDKVSISPKSVRFVDINKDGERDLEVILKINKFPTAFTNVQTNENWVIKYIRQGNRFFPTPDSQIHLARLSTIVGSFIDN